MSDIPEINDSLANLEEELSKLSSVSSAIQKAQEAANSVIAQSKIMVDQVLSKSNDVSSNLIRNSKITNEEIIHNSETTSGKIIQVSNALNQATKKLIGEVNILTSKIDNIDFPSRLDKLDATVSSVNLGLQNNIGRLDLVEKNLRDNVDVKISLINNQLRNSNRISIIFSTLITLLAITSLISLIFQK